jgi:hypothetical protein
MSINRLRPPRLSNFARVLFAEWRKLKLPVSDANLVVAVSGGADSTAMLLALEELTNSGKLSLPLVVAHLDHGLRPESKKDARWVSQLAKRLGFIPVIGRAKVAELANANSDNLEQAARRARYDFLKELQEDHADFVLSATQWTTRDSTSALDAAAQAPDWGNGRSANHKGSCILLLHHYLGAEESNRDYRLRRNI